MDNDALIDFNHLYNIILDELLKVFPTSNTSFKFDNIYRTAELNKLESDDSYYWFKSFKINHSEVIRHFLIKSGIIEESTENGYDSRLTFEGISIVKAGSFRKYQTLRPRHGQASRRISGSRQWSALFHSKPRVSGL